MTDRAAVESAVLEAIDADQMARDLTEIVAIPSVDGAPAEAEAQRWCADRLNRLGLAVDHWETPISDLADESGFPGMEVERRSVLGCVGTLGQLAEQPALAFYGHTDVVPPGDRAAWSTDPFQVQLRHDAAWGRGTCDMKGGLVAAMAAIDAIQRCGVSLLRPLAVHCVSAEEDGGVGAYATLRRGHHASACVSAEPTRGAIIPANAGSLTFRLVVPGRSTHGSTRLAGVSAIEKFEVVLAALRRLETSRNHAVPPLFAQLESAWPLSVGIVRSGDWASTVPDRLVAEGRYGVRIDETVPEAMDAFEECVNEACTNDPWLREHPVQVSWPGGRFAAGGLAVDHPLVGVVSTAVSEVTGEAPAIEGAPYGSDLRLYVAAGIPTLQYGPGDVRFAHATDEHVDIADLITCASVYALLGLRLGQQP